MNSYCKWLLEDSVPPVQYKERIVRVVVVAGGRSWWP